MAYTRELFLEAFPHADLVKFSFGPSWVSFTYNGMGYDVFVGRVGKGQRIHHPIDPELAAAMTKALGPAWKPPPKARKEAPVALPHHQFPRAFQLMHVKYSQGWNETVGDMSMVTNLTIYTPHPFTVSILNVFRWYDTTTAKKAKAFLAGPNFAFWAQQLNFAVWCATTGCGVGYDMLKN